MAQRNFFTLAKNLCKLSNNRKCLYSTNCHTGIIKNYFLQSANKIYSNGNQNYIHQHLIEQRIITSSLSSLLIPVRNLTTESMVINLIVFFFWNFSYFENFFSDQRKTDSTTVAPQILSKLFPQTAEPLADEAENERKKQEEENRKEKENSWKRMKIG